MSDAEITHPLLAYIHLICTSWVYRILSCNDDMTSAQSGLTPRGRCSSWGPAVFWRPSGLVRPGTPRAGSTGTSLIATLCSYPAARCVGKTWDRCASTSCRGTSRYACLGCAIIQGIPHVLLFEVYHVLLFKVEHMCYYSRYSTCIIIQGMLHVLVFKILHVVLFSCAGILHVC